MLPEWAAGFWQSKLRYRTQDELTARLRASTIVADCPLSVIVVDFFHWTQLGDWRFEPSEWPDPQAMVDELRAMGVRLMRVGVAVGERAVVNYQPMLKAGYFIATERGGPPTMRTGRTAMPAHALPVSFYDSTSPDAREFVWEQLRDNYYRYGIKIFWLDACEPELKPAHVDNLRLAIGPGPEVLNRYPADNARTVYEGMRERRGERGR